MYDLLQDVRFGLRMLGKTPVVAAIAAVSLAMGISANTTTGFCSVHRSPSL